MKSSINIWHLFYTHNIMMELSRRFMMYQINTKSYPNLHIQYGQNILTIRETAMEGRWLGCLFRWIAFLLITISLLSFSGFILFAKAGMIIPISIMFIGFFLLFFREWRMRSDLDILEHILEEFEQLVSRLMPVICHMEKTTPQNSFLESATFHLKDLTRKYRKEQKKGADQDTEFIASTINEIKATAKDLVTLGYVNAQKYQEYLDKLSDEVTTETLVNA